MQPRSRGCTLLHAVLNSSSPRRLTRHTPQTPVPVFVSPNTHSDPHSIPTRGSRHPDVQRPMPHPQSLRDGPAALSRGPQRRCRSWALPLPPPCDVPGARVPSLIQPAAAAAAAHTRQMAMSPRESPDTRVWAGPAARHRTGAWWQNSGGAASASSPAAQTPARHRRMSCSVKTASVSVTLWCQSGRETSGLLAQVSGLMAGQVTGRRRTVALPGRLQMHSCSRACHGVVTHIHPKEAVLRDGQNS